MQAVLKRTSTVHEAEGSLARLLMVYMYIRAIPLAMRGRLQAKLVFEAPLICNRKSKEALSAFEALHLDFNTSVSDENMIAPCKYHMTNPRCGFNASCSMPSRDRQQIMWHGQASPPRSLEAADRDRKDAPAALSTS